MTEGRSGHVFVRFLAVGVLNTCFGYACFALLTLLGMHYSLAIFLATVLGILFNFRTIGQFVFARSESSLIFRFVGVYAVVYVVNTLGVGLLIRVGLDPLLAAGVLTLPVALLAFVLQRKFVFSR